MAVTRVGRSGWERRYRRRSGQAGTGRRVEGDAYPARRRGPRRCSGRGRPCPLRADGVARSVPVLPAPCRFLPALCREVAQRGPGRVAPPVPPAVVPAGGTTGPWSGGAARSCDGCAAGRHSGGLAGWRGPFAPRLCRRVAQRGLVAPSGAMTGVRPAERPLRHRFEPRSCHRTARRAPGRRPSPAEQPPVLRHPRRSTSAARRAAAIRPRPDRSPRSA
jgi:hypothetical protein